MHHDDSNYVFTTEGHLLKLGPEHLRPISPSRQKMRKIEDHQCPAYRPFVNAHSDRGNDIGLVLGIRGRSDAEYSRELVALDANEDDSVNWDPFGFCEKPKVELFVSLFPWFILALILMYFSHSILFCLPTAKSQPKISAQVS